MGALGLFGALLLVFGPAAVLFRAVAAGKPLFVLAVLLRWVCARCSRLFAPLHGHDAHTLGDHRERAALTLYRTRSAAAYLLSLLGAALPFRGTPCCASLCACAAS